MPQEMKETVLVLDFGGQYNQLIARRVREQGVYSVVKSYRTPLEEIREAGYKGIIFTGGPNSVYDEESPRYQREILDLGVPVLGICYGAQLMAYLLGGRVTGADEDPGCASEYGATRVRLTDPDSLLFRGLDPEQDCFMSHTGSPPCRPASTPRPARPIALSRRWRTHRGGCTQCSSTRKSCIRKTAGRC